MKIPTCLLHARRHTALTLALCALLASHSAEAGVKTWTGTTSANWATGTNWGTTAPVTNDSLVFTSATGAGGLTLSDNLMTPGTFNIAGITFNSGSGAYVLNAGTPGTSGFTLTGNVTNSSTNLQTINDLIVTTAVRTFTMTNGGGNLTLGGAVSGAAGGITTAGTGTLTLSATGNSYTGATTVANGTTLSLTGTLTGGTAITLNGNGILSETSTGGIGAASSITYNSSGASVLAGANTYSGLTTVNLGTLSLTGSGTLANTSAVAVNYGTLVVGDTTASTNKLNPAVGLTLGGIFTLTKPTTGTTSQTFASLTLGAGVSTINNSNGAGALTFTGTGGAGYVRNAGGFINSVTANFTNAPTAAGGSSVTNSGTAANDILIGVIYSTTDFAKAAAGTLSATTAYSANTFGSGLNTNITVNSSLSGNTQSLRFGTTASQTLTLGGTTTIESGGILQTVTGTSILTGGSLQPASGKTLWLYGLSGKDLNIASNLVDNGTSGLEKYGSNTVNLFGTNTFAGQIWLGGGGFVGVNNTAALGAGTANINFVGSTTLSANVAGISSARNIVVYTGQTATIATNGNDVTLSGVISNNVATTAFSTFTKTGLGKLTLSGISNFTSPVGLSLTGGELEITGAFTTQGNLGNNSAAAGITFTVSGNGIMSNTAVGGSTGDWNFGGTAGTLGAPTYITLNLTGNGQMTVGTRFFLGKANYVTAVANQSGTSTMTLPLMGLNSDSNIGTNNIYNLNGGTLNTSTGVNIGAGGVLNFNGGTFRAYGNNTINAASASSIGSTVVKAGGAIFNTNGFTTTVAPAVPLTHDSTLGATADGGVTKNGTGTLILGGFSSYTGATTVNAGIVSAVSTVTSTLSITTVIGNGTVSTTGTTAGLVIGQGISGTGIPANAFITAITDGTHFTVSANPTAAGTVTGTFAAAQGLGGGAVVMANAAGTLLNISGTVPVSIGSLTGGGALGGNLALIGGASLTTGSDNTSPAAYAGVISQSTGAGSLTKIGSGTQTLTGVNTYTGATTLTGGTLSVATIGNGGVAGNLGQASNTASNLVFNGGTLQYTGATASTDRNFTINNGTTGTFDVSTNHLTVAGASTATTGALSKVGAGILTLTGANLYTGATNVAAGTLNVNNALASTAYGLSGGSLTLGASNLLPTTSAITLTGGTLALGAYNNTVDSVSLQGGSITGSGTLTSTSGYDLQSGSASAVLAGGGGLTKSTGGTVTLTGANTYSGATVITGGTLALGSGGSISNTSGVNLGTGGNTLDVSAKSGGYTVGTLTGSGTVIGSLTVSTELGIGNSPGTVNFSDLTLGAASTYSYQVSGGGTTADLGNVAGYLTISSGAILNLIQLGSYTPNDKFTLFAYATGNLSGTFTVGGLAVADDTTFTAADGVWKIDYNDTTAGLNGGVGTSYVTLTAVPESGSALLGGLGLLALLRRRRGLS